MRWSSTRWPFQSAPRSVERGDRSYGTRRERSLPVSIRAPLSRAGRHRRRQATARDAGWFQSAPRSVERGDQSACHVGDVRRFQSAPRSVERGDLLRSPGFAPTYDVSIRAPLSRAGRRARSVAVTRARDAFQSAPRSVERGDLAASRLARNRERVSIRAPLSRAGRPQLDECARLAIMFQSAPRSVERGDQYVDASSHGCRFQSAPRSVERGDPRSPCGRRVDDVSIRAPLSRAGRPADHGRSPCAVAVSIRAPLSRAGRLEPVVTPL